MKRGGQGVLAAVTLALAGCASAPAKNEAVEGVTSAPSVPQGAAGRVSRLAAGVRVWLREHYGPPALAKRAQIKLVPDDPWLADVRKEAGLDEPGAFSWRPGERDFSIGTDDPPLVVLSPGFGSHARADALARWIFYVEWVPRLAPWLREGLSETVGARAGVALDPTRTEFDRTIDDLLPKWVKPRPPFPDVRVLAQASAREAARQFADCARVLSSATQGGDPLLVRALLESPPRTEDEIAALAALAQTNAARFPTLARVVKALEDRPLASSTTALVEAATPPPGTKEDELPDAALELASLEATLRKLAVSQDDDQRRIALYGLGRVVARAKGAAPDGSVSPALEDSNALVRATAVLVLARSGERSVAPRLLELAKDAPVEEAPGRFAPLLSVFDALTGYQEPRRDGPQELSLQAALGAPRTAGRRPTYLEIKRREEWLRSQPPREGAR